MKKFRIQIDTTGTKEDLVRFLGYYLDDIKSTDEDSLDGLSVEDAATIHELPDETKPTLTKTEFRKGCDYHIYTSSLRGKMNVIFYDWKQGLGFKYMVCGYPNNISKKDLTEYLYKWVTTGQTPEHNGIWRKWYAAEDHNRFKAPLSI